MPRAAISDCVSCLLHKSTQLRNWEGLKSSPCLVSPALCPGCSHRKGTLLLTHLWAGATSDLCQRLSVLAGALRGHRCVRVRKHTHSFPNLGAHSWPLNYSINPLLLQVTACLSQQLRHMKDSFLCSCFRPPLPSFGTPCPAPALGPQLGSSPWLSKKWSQMINRTNSKLTGRQSQDTRKENVRSVTSGTRGYFMVRVWLSQACLGWADRAALGTQWAGPHSALSPIVAERVTQQGSHSVPQAKGELFWMSAFERVGGS